LLLFPALPYRESESGWMSPQSMAGGRMDPRRELRPVLRDSRKVQLMNPWRLSTGWCSWVFLFALLPAARGDSENSGVRTLEGHRSSVMAVAFSPDGKVLVSGSRDRSIKFWDVRTGRLERTLTEHAADVYSVVFSPKGDLLATGSGDKTVKLWDSRTGKVLR